jgi:hypothetical protein
MWSALTSTQQELLQSGKSLVIEEAVPNNPWPRFIVYRLLKSSTDKVAAVFWDAELDPQYVPNCLSTRMISSPKPTIHVAEYILKMPLFLPNEVYLASNELKSPSPGVYEISWNLLKATYITGSTGTLRVEPQSESETQALIRYSNLVTPGSSIAGLLRSTARSEVVESVDALAKQVESEIQKSPQLLESQLQKMNYALGAKTPKCR